MRAISAMRRSGVIATPTTRFWFGLSRDGPIGLGLLRLCLASLVCAQTSQLRSFTIAAKSDRSLVHAASGA